MEIVFNELSFREYKDAYGLTESFIKLAAIFEKAKSLYGYSHLLFPSDLSNIVACNDKKTFGAWLSDIPIKNRNKILSIVFRRPFTDEYLSDKINALSSYFFVSDDLKIEQEYCDGLATADIMGIPAISLANHEIWLKPQLRIYRETELNPDELEIKNLSNEDVLNSNEFRDYSEAISEVSLQPSPFTFEEKQKRISLRDDHGQDILKKFAERIIRNNYVNGVINSLPFNPKTSRFLKSVSRNGLVEIVLHWEDSGYGMVIETTGRNFKETDEIAKILRDEFDR